MAPSYSHSAQRRMLPYPARRKQAQRHRFSRCFLSESRIRIEETGLDALLFGRLGLRMGTPKTSVAALTRKTGA
jgi:hypothetical protein